MRFTFKKNLTYIFLVYSLILLTCQKSPTGPAGIREYYPLAIGNFWSYSNSDNSYKILDEIVGYDHLSDGSSVFVNKRTRTVRTLQPNSGWVTTVKTGYAYLKYVGDELRGYFDKECSLEYEIILKFPVQEDTTWPVFSNGSCDNFARITLSKNSFEGFRNINIPAGSFENCLKIVTAPPCEPYDPYGMPQICDVDNIRWFAPNVGLVKWAPGGWGSQAFTLRQYRVR